MTQVIFFYQKLKKKLVFTELDKSIQAPKPQFAGISSSFNYTKCVRQFATFHVSFMFHDF